MKLRSTELLKKYNIRLKKSLGQNLLLDPNINRKMAEVAAIGPQDSVIEIGAGLGDLTEALADRAREVLAVEIDRRFEPALRERFDCNPRVTMLFGDILNLPLRELVGSFRHEPRSLKMVSNLPYYVTSPILMHFLESDLRIASLTVMVQKEVADRIVARPGGKDYGIFSVACQLYTHPRIVHIVSPKCFRPEPDVKSAIVHLAVREELSLTEKERAVFFEIVNAAFAQRRKKVINSLAGALASRPDKRGLELLLHQSGISPDSRAETIPIDGFVRLALLVARGAISPK
ncbi:MAG: 16S rRNA (adenine(1518)-N(6)/adenine(1519)-N(6))-dimethyltransferase RsmA [Candidatus Lindowbacteria bacterium]|nr:16S rRNA (adenine(1518)-N(6)/adenine(1519)-N(6))-dimethyltransferase RsmA [Candidatus Lindowbacteria bacterium]